MDDGRVRWAHSRGADLAFRVMGEGPVDLVYVGGMNSHIEVMLEEPGLRRWWERLGGSRQTGRSRRITNIRLAATRLACLDERRMRRW